MIRLEPTTAYNRYCAIGGVLEIATFHDASCDEASLVSTIGATLPSDASFHPDKLKALGSKAITPEAFFGGAYDGKTGNLLHWGSYTVGDGTTLENPPLRELEGRGFKGASGHLPSLGSGGQFAYAFSSPPYGLSAKPSEVQALFDRITAHILPPWHPSAILDWSSPDLPAVSDYFGPGMEWWGVFLFTIHVPALRQLTVIAGSATD